MPAYNGHKNWNHWNVALWIGNDESLYRTAISIKRRHRNLSDAAESFRVLLSDLGQTATPDGAPYTVTSVRAALAGLE